MKQASAGHIFSLEPDSQANTSRAGRAGHGAMKQKRKTGACLQLLTRQRGFNDEAKHPDDVVVPSI